MRLGQPSGLMEEAQSQGGPRIPVLSHQGPIPASFMMEKKAPDGSSGKLEIPPCCHVCCQVEGCVFS